MNIKKFFLSTLLVPFLVASSFAQSEPDEQHLQAAKQMLTATQFTGRFDTILPDLSIALKRQLTNNEPNKAAEIDVIVDEEALLLVARRVSLENEAIKLLAKTYTIEELETMSEFFSSPTGKKYLTNIPIIFKELDKAARIWSAGIKRDLSQNVVNRLRE